MVEIKCDYCGKIFNKKPSLIERSDNDFCSNSCKGKWTAGERHPQYDQIEVNCANCGEGKTVPPSQYEKTNNHFCNAKCQAEYEDRSGQANSAWMGGKKKVCCTQCGNFLEVHSYRFEDGKDFFCDVDCRGNWATESFSGENHPLWEGYSENYGEDWLKLRNKARKRDDGKCQICGIDKEQLGKWPDVHHIEPVKSFEEPEQANFLDNLVCLCSSCHGKVEQGEIIEPKINND